MNHKYPHLQQTDKPVLKLIELETKRQAETLMMIPSENYASKAVEEAMSVSYTHLVALLSLKSTTHSKHYLLYVTPIASYPRTTFHT